MNYIKRIFLFLSLNFLVVMTILVVLNFLHVSPYLHTYGISYQDLFIFCFIWGMGGALISLFLSKHIAKWMVGVKIISRNDSEFQELLSMVENLASEAGLSTPQVGVYASKEVNAFATGSSKRNSLIAVSTGLLERMKSEDIQGVLAHEITHIANGDMVTMTLLQGVVNAFVMFLARILALAISGSNKNNRRSHSSMSFYLLVTLFEIVFMILGSMVIAAYSRYREFRADLGGARLTGKEKMIGALQTLRILQEIKDSNTHLAFQTFKISLPQKRGFIRFFATHPPLQQRIERLQKL